VTQASLYRLYGADDQLLYIGVSASPRKRRMQHRLFTRWGRSVTRMDVDPACDLAAALAAEKVAVRTEQPEHNVHYNKLVTDRRRADRVRARNERISQSKRTGASAT
jgi:predicted GIY-YIG superfamily endonuclease